MEKKHIVCYSGGRGSWYAAKRLASRDDINIKDIILLFTDTLMEDEDLYRFLIEGAANIYNIPYEGEIKELAESCLDITPIENLLEDDSALEDRKRELTEKRERAQELIPGLVWIADGRTPWEVFRDNRFLGNSRIDPCSRVLKRELSDKWIESNFSPEECIVYIGVDWTEIHRYERLAPRKLPYIYEAPLCEPPYISPNESSVEMKKEGIEMPRLYRLGFSHNNCGGFCIKAGQGHFKTLAENLPERFEYHAREEQSIQELLEEEVTVLNKTVDGIKYRYPLLQLGKELKSGNLCNIDESDIGGCGCFLTEYDKEEYESRPKPRSFSEFIKDTGQEPP